MTPRRTLAGGARVWGVGLFSARPAAVAIRPGAAGIVFRRTDLPGAPEVPARADYVLGRDLSGPARGLKGPAPGPAPGRNTTLVRGDAGVATTEHVLSALAGLGVTDAVIDVSGPEVPILDGSALPFVEAVVRTGVVHLPEPAEPLVLTREVVVEAGGGRIVAGPARGGRPRFTYELDYGPGAPIPPQSASWSPGEDYAALVAPARTFCLEVEARAMREAGLFAHLSPRDMLVIGPAGPIDNTLRFPDEPARHKLLDLIGDLALVGRPLLAEVTATRSGHALNAALAAALSEHGTVVPL